MYVGSFGLFRTLTVSECINILETLKDSFNEASVLLKPIYLAGQLTRHKDMTSILKIFKTDK
jgi:hypothetical protein